MLELNNLKIIMREYIETNLRVIKKHLNKRKKIVSKTDQMSITEEFMEWTHESMPEDKFIWTLPDLTVHERLDNFCRSIKKKVN